MCRRIALGFLLLFLLFLGGVGYLFYNITRPGPHAPGANSPSRTPETPERPSPEQERAARRSVKRLEEQVPPPRRSGVSPAPRPLDLRITETEVNDMIAGLPDVRRNLLKQKIHELRVDFEPDRLVASARVPLFSHFEARVTVKGRVWAEDGKLAYETVEASAGDFPLPGKVRALLNSQLKGTIDHLNKQIDIRVEQVTVTDDALEIRGKAP